MKKIVLLIFVAILLSGFGGIQQRTITGVVSDAADGSALPGVNVLLKGTTVGTVTDARGRYEIDVPLAGATLVFSMIGFETKEVEVAQSDKIDITLHAATMRLEEVVMGKVAGVQKRAPRESDHQRYSAPPAMGAPVWYPVADAEEYADLDENTFHGARTKPLSTFSIDVDVASYANVRRFVNHGQRPPADAVRIEEMINYFRYNYKEPSGAHPFSVYTEIGPAPWNDKHQLVHIGLQGKNIPVADLPPANLVFLIDVSGSMNQHNKLPLVKHSFRMLAEQLRDQDHVGIVVYAGAARVVLEPTAGSDKQKILAAIDNLQAGGSTAGGAGLRLAYALAEQHLQDGGNNRVILATDGDFNVGESSNEAMEKLIEDKRRSGVYLTVLGYGMGNLKDAKMEILADKGNGNYAYIDNLTEARKVLVSEMAGTLFTIANDVKLQVEFNPARVQAWRLIGYENRKLQDEDFNNDRKDAGELGAGHTVTALYEVIPVGVRSSFFAIDDLKYQPEKNGVKPVRTGEWLTVKLRYKRPGETRSVLLDHVLRGEPHSLAGTSDDFRWSAAVAAFGMLLRESPYVNEMKMTDVVAIARAARGREEGYRSEFINLAETSGVLYHTTGR